MGDSRPTSVDPVQGTGAAGKDKETVKVVVRCRPLFGKELVEGRTSIVSLDLPAAVIAIKCPENGQVKPFTFDSVYDETTTQRQFYDESAYPLVESIFEGYNGTIFAYGQTGCGKTHTMQGQDEPRELRGVIPLSFGHVFENISADTKREYMVRASYLEIYNEEIRDLLGDDAKKRLELKEGADGGVYVKDLTEVVVSDFDAMNKAMMRGFKNRTVGATLMNQGSSRSHSIFTIVVETSEKVDGDERFKAGKLNLVDLAGSERQSKTGATGSRLKEGCKINLSLSALGNVISALVDGKGKHIPYRDSKLTRLLQDSLGGNTKTLMVAAVSPADYNYDETLSTLRYANRAKNIKNKPVVNEDPKDAKLREFKEEIDRLRKLLETQTRGGNGIESLSGTTTPDRLITPNDLTRPDMYMPPVYEANLAKEREEVAKRQQEAQEMYQKAQKMMEEAKALQQQKAAQMKELKSNQLVTPRLSTSTLSEDVLRGEESDDDQDESYSPGRGESGADMASLEPTVPSTIEEGYEHTPNEDSDGDTPNEHYDNDLPKGHSDEDTYQKEAEVAAALEKAERMDSEARKMMEMAEKLMKEASERSEQTPKVEVVKELVYKEVIPDDHLKQHEELKKMNESMLNKHAVMGQELKQAQDIMEAHMREKSAIEAKLRKIEGQILGMSNGKENSSTGVDDTEIALIKQQVEYRRAQIKLRQKAKKDAKREAEKKALEAEKHMIEEELKSTQEQVQVSLAAAKKREMKYKHKMEAAKQEVTDLTTEFERERENLLDTIREQTKEFKLLEQLVELFMPHSELVKVWERSVWNEEKEEWRLPKIKPRSDFQKLKLPTFQSSAGSADINKKSSGERPPSSEAETGGAVVVLDDEYMPVQSTRNPPSARLQLTPPSYATARKRAPSRSKLHGTVNGRLTAIGHSADHNINDAQHKVTMSDFEESVSNNAATTRKHLGTLKVDRKYEKMRPEYDNELYSLKIGNGSEYSTSQEQATNGRKSREGLLKSGTNCLDGGQGLSSQLSNRASAFTTNKMDFSFGSEEELLAAIEKEYEPRDRLESRQGSRGDLLKSRNGHHSEFGSSQSILGEFDRPEQSESYQTTGAYDAYEKASREKSKSKSGSRKHRDKKSKSSRKSQIGEGGGEEVHVDQEFADVTGKSKHKKKHKHKERGRDELNDLKYEEM